MNLTKNHRFHRETWYRRFHDLMPFRVREVLLVSSPYDAFILEEDGRLTERLFTDYSELNLSSAPRITHATSGSHALELLKTRGFDLVVSMVRLADMDVIAFNAEVKKRAPRMPTVMLAFTEAEIEQFPKALHEVVDHVFLWTGDSRIMLAMIKQVEDRLNVDPDTKSAGVRVIVVVEDSVRYYSAFLSVLYSELMTQSQSLISEGLNDLHKLMRMRARPKVLHARTYEQALDHLSRYHRYIFAAICDVRFWRDGKLEAKAGFELAKAFREKLPDIPILMQSSDSENAVIAEYLGLPYSDKCSDHLIYDIRRFLKEGLGFGDFVFRLPDRTEVGRAKDMYEMEQVLCTVPSRSIEYHASRDHFSLWLMARSFFQLAEKIRPTKVGHFDSIEAVREHLLAVLRKARMQEQEGVIADFSPRRSKISHFLRLGSGSIGGKGRGLAFAHSLLAHHNLIDRYDGLEVRIPRSVLIGTDEFDRFIDENDLAQKISGLEEDNLVLEQFLDATLPEALKRQLFVAVEDFGGPLAVRSSSLLEDSHFLPFAGIYSTFMLPNSDPDPQMRFDELCRGIKAVYASTFSQNARSYISGTPYRIEEEKMGVVIQEMVGRNHKKRFYPEISGVGLSYNYYPVGHQRAEDGIVMLSLGLGENIVSGGSVLQFSPSTPDVLPQFPSARDFLKYSQAQFFALDMTRTEVDFFSGAEGSLGRYDLKIAEEDGALAIAGSVYLPDEDRIRDNLNMPGPRVVTFNNILRWNAIPLAEALDDLLRIVHHGIGCPVEIEFAIDMGDWGRHAPTGMKRRSPRLYVLQIRPQVQQLYSSRIETEGCDEDEILCHTDCALGHGHVEDIRDVVYVKRNDLDSFTTPKVAEQVGKINARLQQEQAPYLLVGPGRWGTSDSRLGIPVQWKQIAGAKIIVETAFNNRIVEPSLGTHFFHNITTFRIGYLTLNQDAQGHPFDQAWFDEQPAAHESQHVRHVRLPRPLRIRLNGQEGKAVILKPTADEILLWDN